MQAARGLAGGAGIADQSETTRVRRGTGGGCQAGRWTDVGEDEEDPGALELHDRRDTLPGAQAVGCTETW